MSAVASDRHPLHGRSRGQASQRTAPMSAEQLARLPDEQLLAWVARRVPGHPAQPAFQLLIERFDERGVRRLELGVQEPELLIAVEQHLTMDGHWEGSIRALGSTRTDVDALLRVIAADPTWADQAPTRDELLHAAAERAAGRRPRRG